MSHYRYMASLLNYTTEMQSRGRLTFIREEAMQSLQMNGEAFRKAAKRLEERKLLVSPRPGFYVAVPPQYLSWGAPPPSWYIDDMMRHEARPYYVGLLKAAELEGATHHAVMEFQVMTDKQLPRIKVGRSLIVFYFRKDLGRFLGWLDQRKTDTGSMLVSRVELTVLDLLRYPYATGGVDAIATVLKDLGPKIDARVLGELGKAYERSVVQRTGYLLDWLGFESKTSQLNSTLKQSMNVAWTELEPTRDDEPKGSAERNTRWRVLVNRVPEIDE